MNSALVAELIGAVAEKGVTVSEELRLEFEKILTSYHVEKTGTEVAVVEPGLPRAAKDYLVSRSIEGLSAKTLKSYRIVLTRFFTDVRRDVNSIDSTVIKLWLYSRQKDGLSMRTVAYYKTIISTFFRWCEDNDIIGKNPAKRIAPIKFDKPQHHALTPMELLAVRYACKDVRERALIEMLYSTGCRVSEFIAIKKSDVDMNRRTIKAYNFKARKDKTVYMSDQCAFWYDRYLKTCASSSDVLFPSRNSGRALSVSSIETILRDIGKRAGLPKGRLHPHILRHTLATDIVSNGGTLADAQSVLDHRSPETTLIYAELSSSQLRETHRRCCV